MRILLIDTEGHFLDFALRCISAGHDVILAKRPEKPGGPLSRDGEGMKGLKIVDDWRPYMKWAKDGLIMPSGNFKHMWELDAYREHGFKIFGPTVKSAQLEINREAGMKAMQAVGIELPPYQMFNSLEEAEAFARKQQDGYVFKTLGDEDDKSLSFVAADPAELVQWIRQKIEMGMKLKGPCMLQEKIDMLCDYGAAGWMGPEGFLPGKFEISFEHKKLMDGEVGPACFDETTEVLTDSGWKFWPEVTSSDRFCSLKDGKIVFDEPLALVDVEFEGELIGWKSKTTDILVTPNHKMYVQDDHSRKPFFFERADVAVNHRRRFMKAGGDWVGEPGHSVEKAALVGAYIADGHCHGDRSICFGNIPEHKEKVFVSIARQAGYEARKYGRDLYINSKSLCDEFRPLGLALDKYVPDWIMRASSPVIMSFLAGYAAGDGLTRKNNLIFTTISKRLADQVQELCLKVGWAATISTRDRRGESHILNGRVCRNNHVCYDISVARQKLRAEFCPEMSYRQPHKGRVYCCTVPSHVIYVRRNGKAYWIGQTGEQGTLIQMVETDKLIEECLKPLEPILRTIGHCGDFAIGVGVDKKGRAWPFEFTTRCGWPDFHIRVAVNKGDPAQFMRDWLDGKDTLKVDRRPAIGVVMAQPPYPESKVDPARVEGSPIYGCDEVWDDFHPIAVMLGKGAIMKDGKVAEGPLYKTTGAYVAVATGIGSTIERARDAVYEVVDAVKFPNKMFRRDIGCKVQKVLPDLHRHGYVPDLKA